MGRLKAQNCLSSAMSGGQHSAAWDAALAVKVEGRLWLVAHALLREGKAVSRAA